MQLSTIVARVKLGFWLVVVTVAGLAAFAGSAFAATATWDAPAPGSDDPSVNLVTPAPLEVPKPIAKVDDAPVPVSCTLTPNPATGSDSVDYAPPVVLPAGAYQVVCDPDGYTADFLWEFNVTVIEIGDGDSTGGPPPPPPPPPPSGGGTSAAASTIDAPVITTTLPLPTTTVPDDDEGVDVAGRQTQRAPGDDTDDGSSFPWWVLALVPLIGAGGGLVWARVRNDT